jgi:nucleotide-binding universal stress UspA family protein
MYKKILVPLDGSELAEKALKHAHTLARSLRAELVLIRVVVFITQDFDVIPMEGAVSDEAIADAKRYLERAAGDLRRLGLKVTTKVRSGHVADTIIDYSENHAVDLIVMSTHGRTGPARWLIGSVADRVVHGGRVPVLLVRGRR